MLGKITLQHQLGISIWDLWVELQLDGSSVFRVLLDEHGLPLFSESVKKELPPYMAEVVDDVMPMIKNDDPCYTDIHLNVEHEGWCAQVTGMGVCDCNPVLHDYKCGKHVEIWTCALYGESSIGYLSGFYSDENSGE